MQQQRGPRPCCRHAPAQHAARPPAQRSTNGCHCTVAGTEQVACTLAFAASSATDVACSFSSAAAECDAGAVDATAHRYSVPIAPSSSATLSTQQNAQNIPQPSASEHARRSTRFVRPSIQPLKQMRRQPIDAAIRKLNPHRIRVYTASCYKHRTITRATKQQQQQSRLHDIKTTYQRSAQSRLTLTAVLTAVPQSCAWRSLPVLARRSTQTVPCPVVASAHRFEYAARQ